MSLIKGFITWLRNNWNNFAEACYENGLEEQRRKDDKIMIELGERIKRYEWYPEIYGKEEDC